MKSRFIRPGHRLPTRVHPPVSPHPSVLRAGVITAPSVLKRPSTIGPVLFAPDRQPTDPPLDPSASPTTDPLFDPHPAPGASSSEHSDMKHLPLVKWIHAPTFHFADRWSADLADPR